MVNDAVVDLSSTACGRNVHSIVHSPGLNPFGVQRRSVASIQSCTDNLNLNDGQNVDGGSGDALLKSCEKILKQT